jgi:hypothetical protein
MERSKSELAKEIRQLRAELERLDCEYLEARLSTIQQLHIVRAINAKSARLLRLEDQLEGRNPGTGLRLVS